MSRSTPTRVVSIGCSCINRFQFDFFVTRHPETADSFPRGLFDWNIASLEATLNILSLVAHGRLPAILEDENGFNVAFDALIVHDALPGFSFFHEETPQQLLGNPSRSAAFRGKIRHLAQPFLSPSPEQHTHLVWSNLQPNLPDTVENVIPWSDFVLTEARYQRAKALGHRIFGHSTTFTFLTTPEDTTLASHAYPDVRVIPLARSAAYEGDPMLYDTVLREALQLPG